MSRGSDEAIGKEVRRIRESWPLRLTQQEVAATMAANGHPWRQQTVDLIERGQRSIKLKEARALCDVLRVGIDQLIWQARAPQ